MADSISSINNGIDKKNCYKIIVRTPNGNEEVYETNLAFLICDTGDRIQTLQMCRNGTAFDVFQLVRVGQRAILDMIPEKHRKMFEAFISSIPENEETDE